MKARIAVFGSTGSIGTQALDVMAASPDQFDVAVLTAQNNDELLVQQALKFKPAVVVIGEASKYQKVKQALAGLPIEVAAGEEALEGVAASADYDTMLACIVGYAGLRPTLNAVEAGRTVALANKETLVVAGDLVMKAAREKNVAILPVDSEHSAVFQCLLGEEERNVEKVILTASGGPFRGKKPNFLVNVKRDHALQHPNWNMGAKITIDSATLMNKGLEMIEARWLFDLKPQQIEVVVHPQSIVHSMVQFCDGSIKAQMGLPDMKLPIQYALAYPRRLPNAYPRVDWRRCEQLTFEEPDVRTFKNLALATEALYKGGNLPCIMNAANEIAVWAFLKNRIGFLDMMAVVEQAMQKITFIAEPTLDDYLETDAEAREFSASLMRL